MELFHKMSPTDTAQGKGRTIKVSPEDLQELVYHAKMARNHAFRAGFSAGICVWMIFEIIKQLVSA